MAGRGDISAGRAFVELYVKSSAFTSQLSAMSAKWQKFGSDLQSMGRTMATAGAILALPFGLAVQRFQQFDDQMRAVQAVSGSTAAELAVMTEEAKRLGATTSFTAVEVASLMTELGRAGFNSSEVNKMTGSVLNLARATGTDATLSAGIMAASLRQFSMNSGEAARVSDALAVAANKSFNSVETLGESLSYAGPVAADFNMSIEDTLAILGGLGNVGIQGSNAGTAVRRLLTITGAEAGKLKEIFGVNFVDSAGNARPLIDTLEEVNNATKGLGTAARAEKFNEAFGLLGITGASAISKNVVSIRDLRDALDNAGGSAQDAADKMDAGIGGALRILESSVEGVAIAIGESLGEELKTLMQDFTKITTIAIHWIGQNKDLVVQAAKFAAMLVFAGAGLMLVGTAIVALTSIFGALGSVVSVAMATLGVAPVLALLGVFGALGVELYKQVGGVQAIEDAFVSLGGKVGEWKQYFAGLFADLGTTFATTWSGITDAIAVGDLALAADIAWAGLMSVWERGTIDIRKAWSTGIFEMQFAWQEVTATFGTYFIEAISGMKIAWADASGFFQRIWATAWGKIKAVTQDMRMEFELGLVDGIMGQDLTEEQRTAKKDEIRARYAAENPEVQAAAAVKAIEEDRKKAVQDALEQEQEGKKIIEAERAKSQADLTKDYEAQTAAADKRLADAKAKLEELRGQAAGKVVGKEAAGIADLFGAGGVMGASEAANAGPESVEGYLAAEYAAAAISGLVPAAAKAASGGEAAKVAGSYTAAGLAALGAGGGGGTVQQKILSNAEKQTIALEGIDTNTQKIGDLQTAATIAMTA